MRDIFGERAPGGEARLELVLADLVVAGGAFEAAAAAGDERHGDAVADLPARHPRCRRRRPCRPVRGPAHAAGVMSRIVPHPAVPVAAAKPGRLDLDRRRLPARASGRARSGSSAPRRISRRRRLSSATPYALSRSYAAIPRLSDSPALPSERPAAPCRRHGCARSSGRASCRRRSGHCWRLGDRQMSASPGVSPWQNVPVSRRRRQASSSGWKPSFTQCRNQFATSCVAGAEQRAQRGQHAQIVHRMDVAGDHLRQHPDARAAQRIVRQQRRFGHRLVEKLDDRQRLRQKACRRSRPAPAPALAG